MIPATSRVSKPSSLPMPWSSWTTWSPVRSSAKDWSARPAGCGAAAGAAAEDLRVGEQREPEVAPDEAAARVGDCEQELRLVGQLLALVDQPGVDAAQQILRAQRFALVRERDDGSQAAADERAELVLGFGEAARGDRGPLRLERERLAGRERVELDRVRQVDGRELLLLPDLADVDRLPDEVGA